MKIIKHIIFHTKKRSEKSMSSQTNEIIHNITGAMTCPSLQLCRADNSNKIEPCEIR